MKRIVRQVLRIDVAQKELVVCLGRMYDVIGHTSCMDIKTFANTVKGFETMILWIKKQTEDGSIVRYGMEATGIYQQRESD